MSVSPETQETLKKLQVAVATVTGDSSVMDLDPSNECDAQEIMMLGGVVAAIVGGHDVEIETEDEDGHVEAMSLTMMGQDANGETVAVLAARSNDGTLAPETASVFAGLDAVE